jgi:hypothetical protein
MTGQAPRNHTFGTSGIPNPQSARDCHVRVDLIRVDLIRVDLMRWTLIDHAPRKDMIRNPPFPSIARIEYYTV